MQIPCLKCGASIAADVFQVHFDSCPGSLGSLSCPDGWIRNHLVRGEFLADLQLAVVRLLVDYGDTVFFNRIKVIRQYKDGKITTQPIYAVSSTGSLHALTDPLQSDVNRFLSTLPAPVQETPPLSSSATVFLNALADGSDLRGLDVLKANKDRIKFNDLPGAIAELYNRELIEVLNPTGQARYRITEEGRAYLEGGRDS